MSDNFVGAAGELQPKYEIDANNHKFQHEGTTLGTTNQLIIGPPAVFLNPARTFPTAAAS